MFCDSQNAKSVLLKFRGLLMTESSFLLSFHKGPIILTHSSGYYSRSIVHLASADEPLR